MFTPPPQQISRETEFGPVVQIAYHAPMISLAASYCHRAWGAGPFFQLTHIPLMQSLYRGRLVNFDHSSAYGQCGDVMIELIHQHDDRPSALRDMYDSRTPGLHHLAVFVDDLDAALDQANARHYPIALDAQTRDGVRFIMLDTRERYNAMLELYEASPALTKFYSYVAYKAKDWDGENLLRFLG